jgi:hypothetical protein
MVGSFLDVIAETGYKSEHRGSMRTTIFSGGRDLFMEVALPKQDAHVDSTGHQRLQRPVYDSESCYKLPSKHLCTLKRMECTILVTLHMLTVNVVVHIPQKVNSQ